MEIVSAFPERKTTLTLCTKRCEPSSEMGRLATGLEWMDGLKLGLEVLPTLTTPSCHQMQSGPTRRLGFPTVGSHAEGVKFRVTK